MKVLGIGESVIDTIISVDNLNSKNFIENAANRTGIGGLIPSALIVLSRLGVDCTFFTALGNDDEAKIIKNKLTKENIKLVDFKQKFTKKNIILVDPHGKRKKIKGSIQDKKISKISKRQLKDYDFIIIDRHQKKAFYETIEKKELKSKIIIDTSTEISEFTMDMVKMSDYPIVPIEYITMISKENMDSIEETMKMLSKIAKKTIVVTAGKIGSYVVNNSVMLVEAFPSKVIDVTGAGDVYRGAFIFGLLNRWDLIKVAKFANYVSALQCERIGNVGAVPSKEELMRFFKENQYDLVN